MRRLLPPIALALALTACSEKGIPSGSNPTRERPSLPTTYRATGHAAAGDVFVHLFDWPWPDIAAECENVLGPAGYKAVQVSPPNEHSITPSYDWSERYQPVSYSVARSRSGTGAQFQDMVTRCANAGVGIYVDAVINHMTNFPSPGTGSNGTAYTKYNYPGLWNVGDFHPPCGIGSYQDAAQVQDCELFSLPDLDTGQPQVRQKLAEYLIALARMGVAGFRIDAAKHIQQVELDDIIDRANLTLVGEGRPIPYVFLEVVGSGSGEAVLRQHYYGVGYSSGGASDITEFNFVGVGDKFRKVGGQSISQLDPNGPSGAAFNETAWNLMPSEKGVVFLQNHDTQRGCGIGYQHGDAFRLANVWMLAQPHGYPSILSGYAFQCGTQNSLGPASDASGWTLPVACVGDWSTATSQQWTCEHRDPYIRNMVRFRRTVAGEPISGWWDNDGNAIAFSRGVKGFVAINRETAAVTQTVTTTLPNGTYCDRLTGGLVGGVCAGTTVTVSGGQVTFTLAPDRAIAIDIDSRP
ncbi:MAG: alpha-amylase family protein [Gemmatimonadaceae bacterium]|nr:alpha-amylase family protein [Gemmatimonadaceae bacterium]